MKKIMYILGIAFLFVSFSAKGKDSANSMPGNQVDSALGSQQTGKKVKMILDLDTGIDDAMALAYAIGNPNIDLIGVTTTYGNVSTQTGATNVLNLLTLLNKKNIPVYMGADRSVTATTAFDPHPAVKEIHGQNGVGNVEVPKSNQKLAKGTAVDFIIESANKYGKDLYLVATGAETNLADLVKKDPNIGQKLGNIVIMGGALIVEGNIKHYVEANIYKDPTSANAFFTSGTPFTMVGLDVTLRTLLTKADTQKWRDLGTKSGKIFADIVDYYITWQSTSQPFFKGCTLHDPLAVAVAIHPEFVKTLSLPMKVGTTEADWGRTVADFKKLNDPSQATVKVAVDVDTQSFENDFNKTLLELFRKN